jgi:AraC-like DNA-binding protein
MTEANAILAELRCLRSEIAAVAAAIDAKREGRITLAEASARLGISRPTFRKRFLLTGLLEKGPDGKFAAADVRRVANL